VPSAPVGNAEISAADAVDFTFFPFSLMLMGWEGRRTYLGASIHRVAVATITVMPTGKDQHGETNCGL
jgi:hypothetical protein